ncbi:SCO family protein [Atopomonas sediminilitoris]|uniref:SCO family protein n=1 Tax=Atopomonas sediminilitoris TaxID=2919919 RepID=UPI001F4D71BA|nr:SCO family protein [Atopomonas sediminilitoris]MCJ8170572.1 SCO family protein [Atopomonas sediminilitoris]
MTNVQKTVAVLLAVIAMVLGLTIQKVLSGSEKADLPAQLDAGLVMLQEARDLPALTFTSSEGQAQDVSQLLGQWRLVFLGFTFCPDICPTVLAELRQLQHRLPEAAKARAQVVLVSVDPARDTPAQLKQYLSFFDPSFVGLVSDIGQTQALATVLGIPFIPADTTQPNYTVDHGGNVALIGPDGRLRGFIRTPLKVDRLLEVLPAVLQGD